MFEGRHLVRSERHRLLAGVCGGISASFGVSVHLVRLVWLSATVLTGLVLGTAAYIVLAVLVPVGDTPECRRHRWKSTVTSR